MPTPRSQEDSRRQRCLLYLGGLRPSATESGVKAFLYHLTGLANISVNLDEYGGPYAEAIVEGKGAYAESAKVGGKRCDAEREFELMEMCNEWFCPCGHSGDIALEFTALCPACESERPESLRDGAEAAARVAASSSTAAVAAAAPADLAAASTAQQQQPAQPAHSEHLV